MKRKAQGAIEYLFMLAAALVIIVVVIKYIKATGETAGKGANETVANVSEALKKNITGQING